MNHRVTMRVLALAICSWTGGVLAAETPWGDGYPEYMPDTEGLHGRLHDHSSEQDEKEPAIEGEKTPVEILSTVEPRHPPRAMEQCRRGWVLMEFMVGKDGKPFDIEIVAQDYQELFGRSAKTAIEDWRFKPATSNGQPIEHRCVLPIEFLRPYCGYDIPGIHEASLGTALELPVLPAEGIEQAEIVFLPVFGDFFGSPQGAYVHAQKWFAGDVIPLHLAAMNGELTMKWPGGYDPHLDVQPEMRKVARVIPSALSGETLRFTDAAGRTLILIYADGEASVRGESAVGGITLHHRVDVPGAGFYWVEFRKGADGQYESVLANDVDQPRITIQKK